MATMEAAGRVGATGISIRELQPGEDGTAFRTLNEEWITHYFALEEKDHEQLNNPGLLLARGGHIYLVDRDGEQVGCVALLPMGAGVYELSKMAVAPDMRGLGVGRKLIEHVIAEARRLGATKLSLGSNSKLESAIRLYESVGFRFMPVERDSPLVYSRANVFMELVLD